MPTDVISSVGSGLDRDYVDLPLWFAAVLLRGSDFISRNVREIAECYDDGDPVKSGTTVLEILGLTSDADHNLIIRTAEGHRHDGTTRIGNATGNGAWVDHAVTLAGSFRVRTPFVEFDGPRFFRNGSLNPCIVADSDGVNSASELRRRRILVHGDTTAVGLVVGTVASPPVINVISSGCITVGGQGYAMNAILQIHELHCLNDVVRNCTHGFQSAEFEGMPFVFEISNCVSINPSLSHAKAVVGTANFSGGGNAQDDSSPPEGIDLPGGDLLDDLQVVFTPAVPTTPPGIVLQSPFDNDVRLVYDLVNNALIDSGIVLSQLTGLSDIDDIVYGLALGEVDIGAYSYFPPVDIDPERTLLIPKQASRTVVVPQKESRLVKVVDPDRKVCV